MSQNLTQQFENLYLDLIEIQGFTPNRAIKFLNLLKNTIGSPNVAQSLFQKYALLEPLATEKFLDGTFSQVISSSSPRYVLGSWLTRLGSVGNLEVRNVNQPLLLRGVTLSTLSGGGTALLLNPGLVPVPDNIIDALAARYNLIDSLTPKYIGLTSEVTIAHRRLLLCGPYGAILRQVTQNNNSWAIVITKAIDGNGYNVLDEVSDLATGFRTSGSMYFPLTWRNTIGVGLGLGIGEGGSGGYGGFLYYQLPANYSNIPDEFVDLNVGYTWRDDFMGSSLDTTSKWNRTVSTAGNIEIDTDFCWLKVKGNRSDNSNGIRSQQVFTRSQLKHFVFNFFLNASGSVITVDGVPSTLINAALKWGPVDPDGDLNHLAIGLNTGAGYTELSNFAHSIVLNGGSLYVFENGNQRNSGAWDSSLNTGMYRVRLSPQANGTCTYEIQGDNFQGNLSAVVAPLGSSTWYTLPVTGSSSPTNNFYFGLSCLQGTTYIGDMKVY